MPIACELRWLHYPVTYTSLIVRPLAVVPVACRCPARHQLGQMAIMNDAQSTSRYVVVLTVDVKAVADLSRAESNRCGYGRADLRSAQRNTF